jgi:hypothetical protein
MMDVPFAAYREYDRDEHINGVGRCLIPRFPIPGVEASFFYKIRRFQCFAF